MGTDRDRRREWMLPAMIRIPPHHPASPPPLFPSFPSSVWECHFSGHCKGYDKKSKWMCLQDRYSDLCNLFSLLLTEHTSAHVWKRKGKKRQNSNFWHFILRSREWDEPLWQPWGKVTMSPSKICAHIYFRMLCITENLQITSKINTFINTRLKFSKLWRKCSRCTNCSKNTNLWQFRLIPAS